MVIRLFKTESKGNKHNYHSCSKIKHLKYPNLATLFGIKLFKKEGKLINIVCAVGIGFRNFIQLLFI